MRSSEPQFFSLKHPDSSVFFTPDSFEHIRDIPPVPELLFDIPVTQDPQTMHECISDIQLKYRRETASDSCFSGHIDFSVTIPKAMSTLTRQLTTHIDTSWRRGPHYSIEVEEDPQLGEDKIFLLQGNSLIATLQINRCVKESNGATHYTLDIFVDSDPTALDIVQQSDARFAAELLVFATDVITNLQPRDPGSPPCAIRQTRATVGYGSSTHLGIFEAMFMEQYALLEPYYPDSSLRVSSDINFVDIEEKLHAYDGDLLHKIAHTIIRRALADGSAVDNQFILHQACEYREIARELQWPIHRSE